MDVRTAKEMLLRALAGVPEVNGVGIGQKNKRSTLVVLVNSHSGDSFIPARYQGYEVVKKLVGDISTKGILAPKTTHKTLINFILDESGSMASCIDATVNGFNEYLTEQQSGPDEALISVYKFSSDCSTLYNAVNIATVPKLIKNVTYRPNGSTALYDAIFRAVNESDTVMASDPAITRVVTVILTDGEENASKVATKDNVKQLITSKEESGKWTFVYLGANQNAWSNACQLGLQLNNVATYDTASMSSTMRGVSIATSNYRNLTGTSTNCFLSQVDPELWGSSDSRGGVVMTHTDDDKEVVGVTTTEIGSKTK